VSSKFFPEFSKTLRGWWRQQASEQGTARVTLTLLRTLWTFVRESTPERRRQRYGDMEYDWDHRVDTTSGTVAWRARLLGLFHSPYQPTEPSLFREMMADLAIEFEHFTFIDLGSGKGRTLLMASEYPFGKIVGVEILPELHQTAEQNLARYRSQSQKCFALEAICGDAGDFPLPTEPLVLYLFNPLPEAGLRRVLANLDRSLRAHRRAAYVLYHNPQLESVLDETGLLTKVGGTQQYSRYAAKEKSG
jgi:SAM-dependent methyltransferase